MGGRDGLTLAEYRRLLDKHGSIAAVAKALGRNERSLRRWAARNVPEYGKRPGESASQNDADAGPTLLLPHLTRPRTVAELCDLVDRSPKSVRAWLQALQDRGFNLRQQGEVWQLDKDIPPAEAHVSHVTSEARRKVGIIADTHLGSKCQQLRHLNDFYDRCQDQGVTDVYNAGDLIAGVGVYKGQHAEIFLHTEDEQIDYAVEYYPRRKGMKTHVIGGNHDLVFVKQGGADPLKVIADRRDDIDYLGPYSAWIELVPSYTMYLLHPDGRPAYASSYKLQKIVESFEGGKKPNVLVAGHWHSWCEVSPRNVHAMLAMCFESQTDHERRHALQPVVGGLILDIDFQEAGQVHELNYQRVVYLVPREHDY